MIILEEQTGLNAGLNRGFNIGKMLKKNVRLKNVSIKNAIKVGKVAIPLATTAMSFIPGGGVASKILDSKVGKLFTKIKNGKAVKFATKKPASSTLFFSLSKSTTLFGLIKISNVEFLILASTLSTKSKDFNDLLIALLHMLQVNPLACKLTFVTCAFTESEKRTARIKNLFFIPLFLFIFF